MAIEACFASLLFGELLVLGASLAVAVVLGLQLLFQRPIHLQHLLQINGRRHVIVGLLDLLIFLNCLSLVFACPFNPFLLSSSQRLLSCVVDRPLEHLLLHRAGCLDLLQVSQVLFI
jgi:hypothetical protein